MVTVNGWVPEPQIEGLCGPALREDTNHCRALTYPSLLMACRAAKYRARVAIKAVELPASVRGAHETRAAQAAAGAA